MAENYIDVANAYPITNYTTQNYNAAGDNVPFTDIESRSKWFASMYNQLGFYTIGHTTASGGVSNYSLVTMDSSGYITLLSSMPVTANLTEDINVGIIYLLNEQSLPLYSASTSGFFPVVMASDFLSLPIGDSPGNSMFGASLWTSPTSNSRSYNTFRQGDYLYYDKYNDKILAFPITAEIPGSYNLLTDALGKLVRLGKIVAITKSGTTPINYVVKFNPTDMYGSGVTFLNSHSVLTDVAAQTVTGVDTWVNSHAGYRPAIIQVTRLLTGSVGDLIGLYEDTYEVYNNRGVVIGVLANTDASYSYVMVSGLWDSDAVSGWGTMPNGLTVDAADIGKTVWASGSGSVSITSPASVTDVIIPVGRLVSTTQVFIAPANGFNAYIEMISDIVNNQAVPNVAESALEVQQNFGGIETAVTIAGTADALTKLRLRRIHTDSSVHIVPLTQTTTAQNTTNHWFALTENSWFNDILADVVFPATTTSTSTPPTFSVTGAGPIMFQTNDLQPAYYYTTAYNSLPPWWPGANGSYRLGWHPWEDSQSMDLSAITYDSTAKTITLVASSDTIYIWHSAKITNDMNFANQLPWVGIFILTHDLTGEDEMCLFSYEGYSGFDTDTFVFNNVNIYTHNATGMISNPTWDTTDSGSWALTGSTNWKANNFPIGGIRLKISGPGTFDSISNKPPYGMKWSALKKGGSSVLGAVDSSTVGHLAWDTTDDVATMFSGLDIDADLQAKYSTLDCTAAGDIVTLSADPTVIHMPSKHPFSFNPNILSVTGVTDTLSAGNVTASTDFAYDMEYYNGNTAYDMNWNTMYFETDEATSPFGYLSGYGDRQQNYFKIQTAGTVIRFNVSGDATDYYGIVAQTATYVMTGTFQKTLAYFYVPETYNLTGNYTVTGYSLYTINDDIVYKPSYIVSNDRKELWLDTSKKHNYRAFSLLFEIVGAKPSSILEVMPGQSHFNNKRTYLKTITLGSVVHSHMTETDKLAVYIQNRPTAPTL